MLLAEADTVRLTRTQIRAITETVGRLAGGAAEVYLFGSRLNDQARGGDVDLLVETATRLTPIERARIKMQLEAQVGLPVDVSFRASGSEPTPFQRLARAKGVRLEAPT